MSETRAVTLAEVRNEMARLTRLLMKANDRYLEREAEVTRLHESGAQNYSGNLMTVLDNDVLLTAYSGASKTLATLATACAAVIQAEVAYATHARDIRRRPGPEQRAA